ncbi:MAG: ATP-binding cassette domain-containing protein [Planctomycetota bacterium]|nr:ATP-binding cassette domain-containing protein [Planctomycetota bacterium]MEC8494992.1 ATP-binding cassette domain-containing protein [Planctomycetota bacterium]
MIDQQQNVPAISCANLSVTAGPVTLIQDISLDVAQGEHVLLVGPSGSGKTTLLRAIAGLVVPAAGEVSLFGRIASVPGRTPVPPEDRGTQMMFQGSALWPHLSVAGTLEFVLKRRTSLDSKARGSRIGELLELVDLEGFETRRAPSLSGGEAQRLALARALAAEPRILLLDEPLGPLDAPRRQALLDRLLDLGGRFDLTVLHVTHDPSEASRIATRTISIREGGRLAASD